RLCGAFPYAVAGPVSPDQRAITMYGKAPIVDPNCCVVGSRDDVLVFNFSPQVQANTNQTPEEQNPSQGTARTIPIPAAQESEYDRFQEQWKVCFDIRRPYQSTSFRVELCDAALSY